MKFAQNAQDEGYVITAYDDDSVTINGKPFSQSLIVSASHLHENWNLGSIELLQTEHINKVLLFKPELIIIGTGDKLVFPAIEIYSEIIKQGIGIDFMDTGAACRTYNILMSESRDVVAGLIL
ncbi:MAG: hypothetical protein DRQ89_14865 [Epsilonproteobacteria bacterium]|nr:MAG: hypothetical protein DRQ89_14865 [Campylobacterota bacterium]